MSEHHTFGRLLFIIFCTVIFTPDLVLGQCSSAPRVVVENTRCKIDAACDLPIALDINQETETPAIAATLDGGPSLACDVSCEKGPAASDSASCFINPGECRFTVTDLVNLEPFSNGTVARLSVTCSELGDHGLSLSDVSMGDTSGIPIPNTCGGGGTLTCVECLSNNDCGGNDTCTAAGVCAGCVGDNDCDDNNPCTADTCSNGTCQFNAGPNNGNACDDGLFCTANDTCSNGSCTGSDDPCDGGGQCQDTCNENTDSCTSPAGTGCDDGNRCTLLDTCDASGGCEGTPVDCSPLNDACNSAVCDHDAGGCVVTTAPDGSSCGQSSACTGAMTCQSGECVADAPVDCDDGVDCTDDTCDPDTGACSNDAKDSNCDDGSYCNGRETCHPNEGCQDGTPPVCEDNVDCTVDSCVEETQSCSHSPDDSACDNGDFCDGVEECRRGDGCVSTSTPCDDGIACTVDACDENDDSCSFEPSDAVCDDGVFCNGIDTCDTSQGCIVTPGLNCDDGGGQCGVSTCDEDTESCVIDPQNEGEACDDGKACTDDDVCTGGQCLGTNLCGVPVSMSDTPTASDALFILRAAVGSEPCEICVCDLNNDEIVTAADALNALKVAVGSSGQRDCGGPGSE